MIELGNDRIYLNEGEPFPFGCPQCNGPVAYTEKQIVTCTACNFQANRTEFRSVRWQKSEVN